MIDNSAMAAKITIPLADIALAGAVAAFISAWCWVADGALSASVPVAAIAVAAGYYAVGTLATAWRRGFDGLEPSFPLRFVVGCAVVNVTLFAIAWFSARAFRVAFVALVVVAIAALVRARPRVDRSFGGSVLPAALAVAMSLVAATLWAQDCLPPAQARSDTTLFRPWVDSFFHATQITALAGVHGADRLQDVQFAFVPARFYHYAAYVTPAIVKALSSATAYGTYAGVFVPIGVVMTGLAAYVLVGSWWGAWPAFAASAAVLVLPEASTHGTRNIFLGGYYWSQLVGPAGMYGVAVLALAWAVLLRGCVAGNRAQIALGWVLGALTVVFKAQFFVASAFLLWVVPPFLFHGISRQRRAAWIAGALASYSIGIRLANHVPGFPIMRLDGSAVRMFVGRVLLEINTGPGAFRSFFAPHFTPEASQAEMVAFAFPFVLACVAGLFTVAYVALGLTLARRIHRGVLLFPALALLNFAVMAVGLALDDRGVGRPEELLHRPYVWAHFVTAAWVGGAAALAFLGSSPSPRRRAVLTAIAVALLAYPAARGAAGAQTKEGWSYANAKVPTAYTEVASYIRQHAAPGDVVQDLRGDPYMVLAALSERRPFYVRFWMETAYGREHLVPRGTVVDMLAGASDPDALGAIARESGIRWVVVHPGDQVAWGSSVVDRPAFESHGYRVYRL